MQGIVLDTGFSRTLVRQDLVLVEKWICGEVSICYAHGDAVSYQLVEVELETRAMWLD